MSDEAPPLRIMGIVNVTPDSFSDGGQFANAREAIDHGLRLADDGAHILDIGGESTRPGAPPVGTDEELARVMPVIEGLLGQSAAVLSIDTRKSAVAKAAIKAGASIWNDVSGLTYDEESIAAAVTLNCDVVLMHAQGDPQTMQLDPHYTDVVTEVLAWLSGRIEVCAAAGVGRSRLMIDPGIGFGKTTAHNLALLAGLDRIAALKVPVLLGTSRKRFIGTLDRDGPAAERLGGSIAAVLAGYARGATVFRVHDVAETRQALTIATAIARNAMLR